MLVICLKWGQHFLRDERILKRIVKYAEINENDIVLEIGAGYGNLTKHLLIAKKVYAVEIDPKLFERLKILKERLNAENLELINQDILEYKFPKEVNKIVGNLPYEISSPLTEKILKFLEDGKIAVLMYQKEFAERMVAEPGWMNYSRLSILSRFLAKVEILEYVPKSAFLPAPKVDSAIVKIVPTGRKYDSEFFDFVKMLFTHKKKKVKNAIIDAAKDKEKAKEAVAALGDLADERVFYLDIDEIYKIMNKLKEVGYL